MFYNKIFQNFYFENTSLPVTILLNNTRDVFLFFSEVFSISLSHPPSHSFCLSLFLFLSFSYISIWPKISDFSEYIILRVFQLILNVDAGVDAEQVHELFTGKNKNKKRNLLFHFEHTKNLYIFVFLLGNFQMIYLIDT